MDEIIFEVLKIIVMLAVLVVTRYLVPWIKQKIGADKLSEVENWAKQAVLMVQQVYSDWNGADKKEYVTRFLREQLIAKNISITDEQLNILIEAAVKQMKIQEKSGNTTVNVSNAEATETSN